MPKLDGGGPLDTPSGRHVTSPPDRSIPNGWHGPPYSGRSGRWRVGYTAKVRSSYVAPELRVCTAVGMQTHAYTLAHMHTHSRTHTHALAETQRTFAPAPSPRSPPQTLTLRAAAVRFFASFPLSFVHGRNETRFGNHRVMGYRTDNVPIFVLLIVRLVTMQPQWGGVPATHRHATHPATVTTHAVWTQFSFRARLFFAGVASRGGLCRAAGYSEDPVAKTPPVPSAKVAAALSLQGGQTHWRALRGWKEFKTE